MPLFPELEPLLERLARAQVAHDEASAALTAAAKRLAAGPGGGGAALRALARCEVLERRARLHLELARTTLERRRAELLDDQRHVPAAFRRRRNNNGAGRGVEVLGAAVERPAAPVRDRAAS